MKVTKAIHKISGQIFSSTLFGVEKESLRVGKSGHISQKQHPAKLGAALTHPFITTDFSEALIEIVTPTFSCVDDLYRFMNDIHYVIYMAILDEDEMLWASSMPCILQGDQEIPIANYGTSNIARLKNLYRQGLGYRYGRSMQTIAGVHYNFSFTDSALILLQQMGVTQDISDFYMGGARNILRLGWLLLYFFGASPAVCKSYLSSQPRVNSILAGNEMDGTVYLEHATSLRMSPIGYSNKRVGNANVSFNSLESYLKDIKVLLETDSEDYKFGSSPQINNRVLQVENELYANVRPKQPLIFDSERHFKALESRGVRYLEVRLLDINPFTPAGITKNQLIFMRIFLIYCLLTESKQLSYCDQEDIKKNNEAVSLFGRDGSKKIRFHGKDLSIPDAYEAIVDGLTEVASALDGVDKSGDNMRTVAYYSGMIKNHEATPSCQFLDFMKNFGCSFHDAVNKLSLSYADFYRKYKYNHGIVNFEIDKRVSIESFDKERGIKDSISFENYLERYLKLE